MSELTLTVAEIKELMDKMARTGLTALEITDGSFSRRPAFLPRSRSPIRAGRERGKIPAGGHLLRKARTG